MTPTYPLPPTPHPPRPSQASTKFQVVRTSRELRVIADVQEVVVTTCCSTVSGASSYSNLAVATVTIAQMEPIQNSTGGVSK